MVGMQANSHDIASRRRPLPGLLDALVGLIVPELHRRLDEAGFGDQRPAHNAVFAHVPPEGIRLTELADRARISKQAMAELVDDLVAKDYLVKEPDPSDGRAKLIKFTDRAYHAIPLALETFDAIEAEWAAALGGDRMAALRGCLEELLETFGDEGTARRSSIRDS